MGFKYIDVRLNSLNECDLKELVTWKKFVEEHETGLTPESWGILIFQNFPNISKEKVRALTGLSRIKVSRCEVFALEDPDKSYYNKYCDTVKREREEVQKLELEFYNIWKDDYDRFEKELIDQYNNEHKNHSMPSKQQKHDIDQLVDKKISEHEPDYIRQFIDLHLDLDLEKLRYMIEYCIHPSNFDIASEILKSYKLELSEQITISE